MVTVYSQFLFSNVYVWHFAGRHVSIHFGGLLACLHLLEKWLLETVLFYTRQRTEMTVRVSQICCFLSLQRNSPISMTLSSFDIEPCFSRTQPPPFSLQSFHICLNFPRFLKFILNICVRPNVNQGYCFFVAPVGALVRILWLLWQWHFRY